MASQKLRYLLLLIGLLGILGIPATALADGSFQTQSPAQTANVGVEWIFDRTTAIQIDVPEVEQPPSNEPSKVRSYGLVLALVCSVGVSLAAVLGSIAIKRRLDRM